MRRLAAVAGGLLAALVILELALRLGGGWIYRAQQSGKGHARDPGEYVVITLGESTTQGSGGLARGVNYPDVLESELRARCPRARVRVENLGLAGTNSELIAEALPAQLARLKPDLVVTMIGINDPGFLSTDDSRMSAIVRPTNLRLVRLVRWLVDAASSRDKRERTVTTAVAAAPVDEAVLLAKALSGELPDDRRFALGFSQPLENLLEPERSRELHERVVKARPTHAWALLELGSLARRSGRIRRAIDYHQRALAAAKVPEERDWFRIELARDHVENGDWKSVEEVRDQVIRSPSNVLSFGDIYLTNEKYDDAIAYLERMREQLPNEPRVAGMLRLARRMASGTPASAPEAGGGAIFESMASTKRSYDEILGRSLAAGAEVLVMQYPTRPLAPLKRMLGDSPKGVWLLSNEKSFLEAVREHGYDRVFYDYFGGSFGHMTELGNRLLAGNAASFLLDEPTRLKARCR